MLRKDLKPGQVFRFTDDRSTTRIVCDGSGTHINNPRSFVVSNSQISSRMEHEVILLASDGTSPVGYANQVDPVHYKDLTPEPIDVTEGWGLNANLASVIWYIARAGRKKHTGDPAADAKLDLEKARRFLSREIARLDGRRAWE